MKSHYAIVGLAYCICMLACPAARAGEDHSRPAEVTVQHRVLNGSAEIVTLVRDGIAATTVRRTYAKPHIAMSHIVPGPLFNGDFSDTDPLHAWSVSESDGGLAPGQVVLSTGQAAVTEGDSFLVTLQQTFLIPDVGALSLSFELTLIPGFDVTAAFIPDAFEATLLDQTDLPVVPPWDGLATSFLNMQEDGTVNLGAATMWDGLTATVDVSNILPGTEVTLFFDFVGADDDTAGGVMIDNVTVLSSNEPPVCNAGGPYTVECAGEGTTLSLDGTDSTDPDPDDTLTYTWTTDCSEATFDDATLATPTLSAYVICPDLLGCTATLTVTDDEGVSDTCAASLTVVDTTPPDLTVDATPIAAIDVDCTGDEAATLPVASASDTCGEVVIADDAPATFPAGETTTVTYTGTDDCGNTSDTGVDVAVLYGADIHVEAAMHTVGGGAHPGSTKQPLVDIEVCGYDKSDGSCAREECGGISHQHYECIALGMDNDGDDIPDVGPCEPMNCCTTDEAGECTLNLPPGDYVIISADATKTVLPDPLGVSASDLQCGDLMHKHLQQIVRSNGSRTPGKTTRLTGSELLIIEPEFVVWDNTEQPYPFVFETIGDWDITVTIAPPDGFVADHESLTEDVNNELEALQFTITEVGSDIVPTGTTFMAAHNGKTEVVESQVDIYLTTEYAQSQGHDVEALRQAGLIKGATPAQEVDVSSTVGAGAMCGSMGTGCGPIGPAMVMMMLGLLGLRLVSARTTASKRRMSARRQPLGRR